MSREGLVIRVFQTGDLPRLQQITIDAFEPVSIDRNIEEQIGRPIHRHDWRWRKARHIAADVQRDPQGTFVAEVDGQTVGYVTTWHDREEGIGYIPNLAVAHEYRGHGIGRRLLDHALDHFRRCGLEYARIETLEQNPIGQRLYPALGFREIARQIHYGMPLDGFDTP